MIFAEEWARCWPYFQADCDYHGRIEDEAWHRERVQDGRMQFWPGPDSAVLTQLVPLQHGLRCEIVSLGGKAATLASMAPKIEGWARRQGCVEVSFGGRVGWSRLFPARTGYKVTGVFMVKSLIGGAADALFR